MTDANAMQNGERKQIKLTKKEGDIIWRHRSDKILDYVDKTVNN